MVLASHYSGVKQPKPHQRRGSAVPQLVARIPTDVRDQAIGRTVTINLGGDVVRVMITPAMQALRLSLRTKNPAEARARHREVVAQLSTIWDGLRVTAPPRLSHRQATALAGSLYRTCVERPDRDQMSPTTVALRLHNLLGAVTEENMETTLGSIIDELLLSHGIGNVDAATRLVVLQAAHSALKDALGVLERNAQGDYSPDPNAQRFPEWQPINAPPKPLTRGTMTLTGLVECWWIEAKASGRKPGTHTDYKFIFTTLANFLGHDDARRVTPEDIVRFKDYRLTTPNPKTGRPATAKTVKDCDLAGLKAVFRWAVANRKLSSNPAADITLKVGKKPVLRSKSFTEEEAISILKAALKRRCGVAESPRTAAAKRWIPWLLAYTGARLGEIAQLRKQDVRQEGEHWLIVITPEAGTVKTNEARRVVLHPHVVELGFVAFVCGSREGHLFLRPNKMTGDVLGPLSALKNRLIECAREVVKDPNVAPNHGWRHRFKTLGMQVGIPPRILDAIQGHAPASVADTYGEVTVDTMAEAISRFPRVDLHAVERLQSNEIRAM
jgi:integrase